MSGYIGNIPVPEATQTRDSHTAAAGQTTFTTSGYTVGYVDVYLNGVKLVNGTDFVAPDGINIILTSGALEGSTLEIIAIGTFQVADVEAGAQQGVFWENESVITANYTLSNNKNAGTFGPVTIADGVEITIDDGSTWTVV